MVCKCQRDDCLFLHQSPKEIEVAYARIHGGSRPASPGQELDEPPAAPVPTGARRQNGSRARHKNAASVVSGAKVET
eukprot:11177273-Lingulodinium_polyedra.AAC.1